NGRRRAGRGRQGRNPAVMPAAGRQQKAKAEDRNSTPRGSQQDPPPGTGWWILARLLDLVIGNGRRSLHRLGVAAEERTGAERQEPEHVGVVAEALRLAVAARGHD